MKQIVGFFSVPHHNAIRTESAYSSVSWIMPSPGSFHLCVENRNYLLLLPQVRAKLETLILSSHAKLFCDLNIPNSCFFSFLLQHQYLLGTETPHPIHKRAHARTLHAQIHTRTCYSEWVSQDTCYVLKCTILDKMIKPLGNVPSFKLP